MDDDQMDASGSGHNAQRKRAHSSGENPENRDAFEPPASRRRQGLDSNSSFFAQQAQVMAQVSSMLNQLQQDSVTMKRRQDVVYQRQVDSQRRQEELQQQQTADIQSLAQAVADLGRRVADFENPQNCPANNNAALVQLQHTSSNPAHAFGVNVGGSTSSASTTSSGSSIGSSVNADTHSDASATSAEPPAETHGSRAPEPHDHPTNPLAQKVFDLPAFSGKPGEWRVFITAYRQSSAAFGYTDLQNLYRLQKSLSGDARIAVEGLLLSPETTETVISNLELNFGRPQLLVSEQTKRIREHLHVRENNYEQLIEYATCVTNVVAYLDTNETRYALHEQSMLAEMLDKLPSTRRYDWLEYAESISTMPTAIEFSVWLKKIAVRVSKMPVLPSTQSRPPNGGRQRDERRCMLNVDESCRLCDGQHGTHECDAFKRQTVVQRWRTVREYNMCFGCLQEGHGNAQCDSSRGRALHHMLRDAEPENGVNPRTQPPQQRSRQESNQRQQQSVTAADTLSSNSTAASTSSQKRPNPFDTQPAENTIGLCLDGPEQPLFFRVVPVTLHGPDRSVDTFALLDEGSSVTLIDTKMADQLKLDGPARQLNLKWIGNQSSSVQSKSLELMISGVAPHCKRHKLCDVRTVDHLRLPTQTVILSPDDTRYDHLRDLPISTYRNAVPTILIGLDHCHLGAASKTRTGKNGGLVAAKTALGWIVYGRRCGNSPEYLLHCCEQEAATIEMMLNDFQSTEGFGVMAPKEDMESDDDMRARALLQKTTVRVGGRFQTGLLWRTEDVQLPDSFAMALRRYNTVARKIKQDAEYGMLYTKQMADLVTKKYARKLSTAEASIRDDRTWFLPHFGVQSVHKPGKLRIVFDAAAMVHNTSLNSALLKGPDLNASLLKILMQFRLRPFGVCADISEMFLQISMRPEDRRAQRFLWREDGGSPPDVYEMMVMTFGAACSPTSAQYAKNANAAEFEAEFPEAAEAIRTLHYVDDFVASFATEADAVRVTRDVCEVHRRGGFTLRGFISNSNAILHDLGVVAQDEIDTVDMQLDAAACSKILGMRWATKRDAFVFATNFQKLDPALFNGARTPTKREMLSAMMSVYDPFGFVADVMLPTKLLMQELWKLGVGWDAPVPAVIDGRWRAWCEALKQLNRFAIPRCYSPHLMVATDVQLHCFADASEEAFAAALYWRICHGDQCTVSFIMGKTRAAPKKQLSVPRLELQAAVMATRLHNTVRESHPALVTKTVFWTDSRTVLLWLQSTQRRFRPFVANRVSEVLDSTDAGNWRWVPTKDNVADDATRSRATTQFSGERRWTRGPEFLKRSEDEWPKIAVTVGSEVELEEEIRARFVGVSTTGEYIDFNRFSSFQRLSRAVGWMMRFVYNVRANRRGETRMTGRLTTSELEAATEHICRVVQTEEFPHEYATLLDGGAISKSSPIAALMPYLDGAKTMRLYGRTDLVDPAFLPMSAQRPILLPNRHRVTALIVSMHHAKAAHQFEGRTICSVREKYWVPHLRTLVRRVRRACVACKIRTTLPKPPIAGQLPIDRMSPYEPPFSYTGVDYFGPVAVAVGRRREKRWVCIFTCLTVRAVHMEVAEDLSTDAFLVCMRDFINVRGLPLRFRSDRGTNFVGAENEMLKMGDIFDCDDVHNALSVRGIEWRFNCPANPEAGGAWERLVQSTKKVLAVTMKEVVPRVSTLRSYIIEAANLINSRPLTHVPVSPDDLMPLTPNHFLLGRVNATTATGVFDPREMCHRQQWRVLTQLKNNFWKRWVEEYLPTLTRREKRTDEVLLKEGDLALICDANQSRGQWLRGRVVSLRRGPDGRVRSAEVQTKDGLKQRPVSKLALLDVEENRQSM